MLTPKAVACAHGIFIVMFIDNVTSLTDFVAVHFCAVSKVMFGDAYMLLPRSLQLI